MERQANYALVGGLALALLAALMVFVVWLAGAQLDAEYDAYDVIFLGSVQGLSEGGDVYFNGIRVGEVTELKLDQRDPNRVVARVRLDGDTPVKVDSLARLEPLGITGVNIIQISAGAPMGKLLKDTVPANRIPVIRSAPSPFTGLLEGGGTVLARTVTALENVNKLLSPDNIAGISRTVGNVEEITADLAQQDALLNDIQRTVDSADLAARQIAVLANTANTAAGDARSLIGDARGLVNGDAASAVRKIEAAAGELSGAAAEARGIVTDLRGPTREFATTGLPQLTQSLVALEDAATSLERVVSEVEANPRSLLTTPEGQTREVAP